MQSASSIRSIGSASSRSKNIHQTGRASRLVVVEQVGEQLPRPLLAVQLVRVLRQALGERGDQRRGLGVLADLAGLLRRTGEPLDRMAERLLGLGAAIEQPLAQQVGGDAVVAVVVVDRLQDVRIPTVNAPTLEPVARRGRSTPRRR